MAREYILSDDVPPQIFRVYDEPGLSWRDAKKNLRQWYLNKAHEIRGMREKDALLDSGSLSEDGIELVSIEHPEA
jgi:hypothetical protein